METTTYHPRKNVEALGQMAASTSKPISVPPHLKCAASWLESKELAIFSDTGKMVLLEEALKTKTVLRVPRLVVDPAERCSQSIWSLRRQLVAAGWTGCKPGDVVKPSIKEKVFHIDSQCQYYYIALLDCTPALKSVILIC